MPLFSYKGRNAQGELIKGVLEGKTSGAVAESLLQTGITPVDISQHRSGKITLDFHKISLDGLFAEKIQQTDIMMFSRQMYSLLKAGIPIMRALAGLKLSTENKALAKVIGDLHKSLDAGHELSVAMRDHPKVFSSFYVSMMRVGEGTGMLETVFLGMFHHLEFEKFMRDKIKSALRYPSFVMTAMFIAIVIVNIFVIPAFAKIFVRFGQDLPLMTRVLIGFSNFTVNSWPIFLMLLAGLIYGVKSLLMTKAGRYEWDRLKLKLPIAGKIVRKATLARFARSFALSYKSGVPIVQAMSLIAETADNDYLADKINQMRLAVERGESVYRAASASGVFTPMVLQMISVGEESGSLDDQMQEIADMYQSDVEYEIKTLGEQVEPIMIVFLGILVLILALGIFLPMWDLGRVALRK